MAGPEAPGDLGVFFDAAGGFAELFTYTPAGGIAAEVQAIWSDPHVEVAAGFGAVSGTRPEVYLALADLGDVPAQGDRIESAARGAFTVADVQPNGTGLARLILEE